MLPYVRRVPCRVGSRWLTIISSTLTDYRIGGAAVEDLRREEATAHDLAQWRILQVRQARSVL